MSNFLGIQIYDALPDVTAGRLSPRCSALLGLDSNRRLTEQEDLPFSLDVVFGSESFPNQVSQVLKKENEIQETQLVMMEAIVDIQKELDNDHKDSKSKKSKKAKGEKAEESQDDESDLFERRLTGIEEMVTKIEEVVTSVNDVRIEAKETSNEMKSRVEKIEEVASSVEEVKTSVHKTDDKVSRMEDKVEKIERSIEDIKEMLSQLIMKG